MPVPGSTESGETVRVIPPDLELWLADHIRTLADAEGLVVRIANSEPTPLALPLDRPVIVIRETDGSRIDWTTFERSVSVTVLAGGRDDPADARNVARWLAGVLFDEELPFVEGSPIATVDFDGCLGPVAATEPLDVSRRALTAQYVVTGNW